MNRVRLDQALVARGLVASRSKARDLIKRGLVQIAGNRVSKPATLVEDAAVIDLPHEAAAQVSRGAVKLEGAMAAFGFDATSCVCLDVGASTGGFTQTLLKHGAAKVYAVDVGRDQLHPSLRDDARVITLEGTDARALSCTLICEPVEAIVADLSFISLTVALEAALSLAANDAWLIALIKPQFEAGRDAVGKGGIVRNDSDRLQAIAKIRNWLDDKPGWNVGDVISSPITGSGGNEEFLIGAVFTGPVSIGTVLVGTVSTGTVSTSSTITKTRHRIKQT